MEETGTTPMKFAIPVGVVRLADSGMTRDELLDLAFAQAEDPEKLRAMDPFIGACIISSNRVDSYYTYMDEETTLPNYAADATAGVSVLDSHDSYRLGFGRSILGKVDTASSNAATRAWWYTPRGMELPSGGKTDSYITGIETGLYKDVSVGFRSLGKTSKIECSICGRDMFNWDCHHWLGRTYLVNTDPDDPDSPEVERIAFGKVINFGLSEFSYVYKGANPDAKDESGNRTRGIPESKVRMFAAEGQMTRKEGEQLQRMYNGMFDMPDLSRLHDTYPVVKPDIKPEENPAPEERTDMNWNAEMESMFEQTFGRSASDDDKKLDPVAAFKRAAERERDGRADMVSRADHDAVVTERDAALESVRAMEPDAKIGKSAMENARKTALAEATRAAHDPAKFNAERTQRMIDRMDYEDLIDYAEEQRAIADAVLAGGRKFRNHTDQYELGDGDDGDENTRGGDTFTPTADAFRTRG